MAGLKLVPTVCTAMFMAIVGSIAPPLGIGVPGLHICGLRATMSTVSCC